jgi:hypothetical protein
VDEMVGVPPVTATADASPTARIEQIPMTVAGSVTPRCERRMVGFSLPVQKVSERLVNR